MIRFIFALLLVFFPVQAKEFDTLPTVEAMDDAAFLEHSKKVEKNYPYKTSLNFTVQIPKNFTIKTDEQLKNTTSDDVVYGEIYRAYGPSVYDLRSYLSVQSIELDRLISAKNWLISKALDDGYTIKALESENDDTFEAFYVRLDDKERSEVVRARGILHENRLILVEYVVPAQLFERDKDKQIHSIKSFTFVNDHKVMSPETIVEYEFLDSFSVKYPKSWRLTRKVSDEVNRHDVSFKTANKSNFLFATADVSVISRKSLKDRVDNAVYSINLPNVVRSKKEELSELGFTADPLLERVDYTVDYETDFLVTEIYPLKRKKSEIFVEDKERSISHELWLTVIKTPETSKKNYIISMVMPSRDANFEQWALAVAAYKVMVESVR